ncbi:MAG TPA: hypothetical protein VJ201_07255, partial [Candidatus Babeliales bacterium]|nr:hypothetical protein [Candidatus Babeliales bacterium]
GFNGRNFYFVFDAANERAKIRLSKIREEDLWVGIEHEIKVIQATKLTWFEWTKQKATDYKTATTIIVTGAAGASVAVAEVVLKKFTGISIIETIKSLTSKQGSK